MWWCSHTPLSVLQGHFLSADLDRLTEIAEECCFYLVDGNVSDSDAVAAIRVLHTLLASKPPIVDRLHATCVPFIASAYVNAWP
jgi:hypothetical protein